MQNKTLKKKYFILSILSGLLFGLSWPTYGFIFLIFISLVPLLIIEDDLRNKSTFKIFNYSFISFFIWNSITSFWLLNSTVFGGIFAIVLYSTLMSIVILLFSKISKKLNSKLGFIFLVTSWIVFEKFNLSWEFSWPSLLIGNSFSDSHKLIQWYEYTGVLGGTLWVLVVNILFFRAYKAFKRTNQYNIKSISLGLITIAVPIIISLFIYKNYEVTENQVNISIIQPNIDPYNEKYGRTNLEILDEFTNTIENNNIDNSLILTPETYFSESPGYELDSFFDTPFYQKLDSFLNDRNSQIISGIQFYKIYNSLKTKTSTSNFIRNSTWVDVYNSSFINSEKKQVYHKSKLVVGVENLPYKKILEPILGNILLDFGGTVMTRATQTYRTVYESESNNYIAPIICYELMYGEFVSEYVRNGAEALAILTNEGWWGDSQGHKQLLSYSKLRSIEFRKSIIRSANTGVSAIISQRGDIVTSIPYNKKGIINDRINLSKKITFYAKYGDYIFRISLFFFLIISLFFFAKKK